MVKTLGIIGFGRFGQLAANHLKHHFEVYVYDCNDKKRKAELLNVEFTDFKECAQCDIVVLCVPISSFQMVLEKTIPYLKKGATLFDVCSVKEEPVQLMKRLIPDECNCFGTHPLFGLDTAKNDLKNKKIVICPIRSKKIKDIESFLSDLGLDVIKISPEEHDRQMAKSLALIHFLGRALENIQVEKVKTTTPTHEMFMELVEIVKNDSKQLFIDMHKYNKYASEIRKKLICELMSIDEELDEE